MSILDSIQRIQENIPHYWPIGSFIHHNPLKGFEEHHFRDGLKKAQSIYGGNVYMEPSYYLELFNEGKISESLFDKNVEFFLTQHDVPLDFKAVKQFILEISVHWESQRRELLHHNISFDESILDDLYTSSLYADKHTWFDSLASGLTLYELNDAIFGNDDKEFIEKEVVEFIARFLDEEQTTLSMPDRELGMFQAFKQFEPLETSLDAQEYLQESFSILHVTNEEGYLLTHLLKLHGWAGFIKYRSNDEDYFAQQQYPSSLIEYLAIRLSIERKYLKQMQIKTFDELDEFFLIHESSVILQLLKYRRKLPGKYIDMMQANRAADDVLNMFIHDSIALDATQIQRTQEHLNINEMSYAKLFDAVKKIREEEGYIWLKSLEDTYIESYVDEMIKPEVKEEQAIASATFCLDVRSEVIRRNIEATGPYKTFGAGGFLGIPLAFVEFDKAHEQFLAPAIIKPKNIIFEIPKESYDEYSSKKGLNKTTKKVLSDLKNNPYTPYIMVEAIGWIFGINLFGKTFWPRKTNKLLSKVKPQKPKTTYTIDKLSDTEIEQYTAKLYNKIIQTYLQGVLSIEFSVSEINIIREALLFNKEMPLDISDDVMKKLQSKHEITLEDYNYQKKKLAMVGFTHEEKVFYIKNYLSMIGQVENFPKYMIIVGHGSVSDNNPFESALDCGACGGNYSLPNTRTLCMIGNLPEVRETLKQEGIIIPDSTLFVPALHITSTDEIKFYDIESIDSANMKEFLKVMHDFAKASKASRIERSKVLPYTHNEEDIFKKSMDWSEPRPEWGLAKNIGVYAGRRNSIKHMKLDNRFFLHSYDSNVDDENASILSKIFNGPLVVGEWINLEHYFSTVDNSIYGAGSKVYHNVVSKVGVYYGNYSDLKIGLPSQSVLLEGKAYHEPVRLLTFVEAPLALVGKAVEESIAKSFILNEWIRPVIIDYIDKKVYVYEEGDFKVIRTID